ncbi:MAG: DNA primase [Gammaproteobacteria bacterium]|nr:DNA primase [Gammaproteobacteria bacterium]MDE2023307.1 DNA primase [Gammaproteobacteria bacterium]MDE2139882.1 DNA primase [Gammaproteobacteria bacterium]MDE2273154.1 DNA primase [Gammaproteobacteria bacterium]
MARIPQSFIDELVSRVDIVEVIDARVPLKKHGREFTACCPFHNEKTPSFTVSPSKQFYHCFGCGAHGTALGFLMEYEHLEFPEAVRQLAEQVGMEVPVEPDGENRTNLAPLYEALHHAQRFYVTQLKQASTAVDYLRRRGVSGEIAAEFGIGFAPAGWDQLLKALGQNAAAQQNLLDAGLAIRAEDGRVRDRFRERVMFPIRDARGRVVGFGGRVIGNDEPKYLNSPETPLFHKGRELYGLYEARQALRDIPRLLVVEGYMDVVALHQHGLPYTVATLGTATTPEHLQKIFRVTAEVIFCFDGDRAGRAAAWRALENALPEARDGRQLKFLFLPEGEDPDTLVRKEGREAFEPRLKHAVPLSVFLLDSLSARTDLSSLDGRARLVELARPHLARLPAGIYREMLAGELARRAQVNPEKLTMLNRASSRKVASDGPPTPSSGTALTGPVRRALALLLHRPALAALAGNPADLANTGLRGVETLQAVLDFAQGHPHITGAGLLEHWRDTETGGYLMKLAQAELLTPDDGMDSEFRAVMVDLAGRRDEQRLAALMEASRQRPLGSEEKAELTRLLTARRPSSRTPKS